MDRAKTAIQAQPEIKQLQTFARNLRQWLIESLAEDDRQAVSESRIRTLLRAANLVDVSLLRDFEQLMEQETAVRVMLYDLLRETGLAEEVQLDAITAEEGQETAVPWLSLILTAFAWQQNYPPHLLDPLNLPPHYTPAGLVLSRTATFLRQQVGRSATSRERIARKLTPEPDKPDARPAPLSETTSTTRPLIPVRYPEIARETVRLTSDELPPEQTAVRGDPITITPADLPAPPQPPPSPATTPNPAIAQTFVAAIRKRFGRSSPQPMLMTRLHVVVQTQPDGPPLPGLQVKVWCKSVSGSVAGVTDENGRFQAQLPVPRQGSLTYHVQIIWPRNLGGEKEEKAISLNADRTTFTLPFYRQYPTHTTT
ncbi:MAG: hypothetical protein D6706_02030 [Chloroflexi bacterium]|nr:MAG: hypothetical protein D6706_02030 [Chloroflexota bacterium]